jgi:hypothetical protein
VDPTPTLRKPITDLAEREGATDAYICGFLLLTCLAPGIVEASLNAGSRRGRGLRRSRGRPPGWEKQQARLALLPFTILRLALLSSQFSTILSRLRIEEWRDICLKIHVSKSFGLPCVAM